MQQATSRKFGFTCLGFWAAALLIIGPSAIAQTQLSLSAYRALGQMDLRQNGANMVGAGTLASPQGVAVDRDGHLYVADTSNHRVLAWTSATAFQNAAPATLVLGQPNSQHSGPYGLGAKGFDFPQGVAVDPVTGNLYVADTGNSRVLRFPKPFANPTRVEPDAVFGQPDFATRAPNSGGLTEHSLNLPRSLSLDTQGNLWVADSSNNRVLRFPAAALNTINPAADLVLGQPDFHSAGANRGAAVSAAGFSSPFALTFDTQNNLYVADFFNTRVMKFPAPLTSASAATIIYGEPNPTTRSVPQIPTSSSMAGPTGVAVNSGGTLYVAVPNDNRILVFAPATTSGTPATHVLGQPDFATVTANTGSFPQASGASLSGVSAVALDAQGDLLAADSGNNRVLSFPSGASPAFRVLGQVNFGGNGKNEIKPGSISSAYKIAVDYSHKPFAIYVSDTNNHRVLVWKDSAHFHTGDPADLVIGQPTLLTALPNVDGGGAQTPSPTGLFAPRGIVVAADGTLYVADSGNNRVLHYPRPVDQSGRITADLVLGQADFKSATSATVSAASLNTPTGLAIARNGNLFVADSGNNRVLEFSKGSPTGAAAVRVYGQPAFNTSAPPTQSSAQTLSAPQGLFVDAAYNLFVADSAANRVLVYPNTSGAPPTGLPASIVIGQKAFSSAGPGGGATGLHAPADVALDTAGDVFVADNGSNRVLIYPSLLSLPTTGGAAVLAIGQPSLQGVAPNWNTPDGLATPEGLSAPLGILVDRQDTLYVGDTGNSRVVHFLKPVTVINAATQQASVPIGLGAMCSLYGSGLSTTKGQAKSSTLPIALAGRELVVNEQTKAPLLYVSPGLINFVFPINAPLGTQRIAARTSDTEELLAGGTVLVATYAPGFFTHDSSGTGQAAVRNHDQSINSAANPAARGSIVSLYGTGQGPVVSPVADGQPGPNSPDNTVAVPTSDANTCLNKQPAVCLALGGSGGGAQLAEIQYSGLAPQLVGVWLVNIRVPATGLLGNTMSVRALIGGANQSNLVTIAIK
jgi:uncharacterized protein (TIGR03437 family)